MSSDVAIKVEGVSKKFCRSLKRSMLYGVKDIAREMLGIHASTDGLRQSEFWAVNDVSFEVRRGECFGIIGPNGAGKSTLLKMLNGLILPDKGKITMRGRVGALLEIGAGFHPMLTGRENIYMSGAILGLSKKEIERKFDEIVAFAELEEFIDTPVNHYSSGMYVRLGFAVAVSVAPDILSIDEVLAVGDALFQAKCFSKLREFKEKGTTIIFVTHNLDLITSQCARALLLDRGGVVEEGSPKAVVDRYNRLVVLRRHGSEGVRTNGKEEAGRPSKEIEWSGLFRVNPKEERYGARKAEILEAGIFTLDDSPVQVLERNQGYLIKVKVRHNEPMPAAIVSYVIKDPKGTVLCGTNTFFQNVDMGWMERSDVVMVTFKQVIRLNPGEYLLSVGAQALDKDGFNPHDRRLDYLAIQVAGKEQRHGIFDPESFVSWFLCNHEARPAEQKNSVKINY